MTDEEHLASTTSSGLYLFTTIESKNIINELQNLVFPIQWYRLVRENIHEAPPEAIRN